jgi:hypothetical protein
MPSVSEREVLADHVLETFWSFEERIEQLAMVLDAASVAVGELGDEFALLRTEVEGGHSGVEALLEAKLADVPLATVLELHRSE